MRTRYAGRALENLINQEKTNKNLEVENEQLREENERLKKRIEYLKGKRSKEN